MTTFATLRRECRKLGMIARRTEWDEYCVAFPGDDAGAYYTPGIDDALDTARLMAACCMIPPTDNRGEVSHYLES